MLKIDDRNRPKCDLFAEKGEPGSCFSPIYVARTLFIGLLINSVSIFQCCFCSRRVFFESGAPHDSVVFTIRSHCFMFGVFAIFRQNLPKIDPKPYTNFGSSFFFDFDFKRIWDQTCNPKYQKNIKIQ